MNRSDQSFPVFQSSSLFTESSPNNSTFNQHHTQLWSQFRYETTPDRNNLWMDHFESTSVYSPWNQSNTNSNLFLSSSSPAQMVPSSFIDTPSLSSLRQRQILPNPIQSLNSSPIVQLSRRKLSSKLFFSLIIFILGLVLGYILTSTFPPSRLLHSFFFILDLVMQFSHKYFHRLLTSISSVLFSVQ